MTRVRIRKQWHAALFLFLGLGLSARAEAHLGDRVFPIPYLSDEMLEQIQLDDGLVDEWYELVGEPARLYVGFVASDDVYKNTHDYGSSGDGMSQYDSIMLAIDGDHSGGKGSNSETPLEKAIEIHGQAPFYQAISRTVRGPTLNDFRYRFQIGQASWTTLPPYGDSGGGAAGEAPVIWVIELYVTPFDRWGETWQSPEGSVVSRFAADQVIGFAIAVLDHDPPAFDPQEWSAEVQQPDDTYTWFTTFFNISFNRADTFLDGLLLPADPAGPGDSAVESVSWGRIKASLEME